MIWVGARLVEAGVTCVGAVVSSGAEVAGLVAGREVDTRVSVGAKVGGIVGVTAGRVGVGGGGAWVAEGEGAGCKVAVGAGVKVGVGVGIGINGT